MPVKKNCPNCNITWESPNSMPDDLMSTGNFETMEEVKETAHMYGWTESNDVRFSKNVIGIEDPKIYDGVLYWECTNCNTVHDVNVK